jgi:pimeloyl-ACP methyl ester carboxylesterase
MGSLIALECAARHPQRIAKLALVGTAFPMRVADELLNATRDDEPTAQQMVNLWSHSALAHYPGNPGPGFWVAGVNRRLMERQRAGVMHADFTACNDYSNGLEACRSIVAPVLLVLGKRDVMTPPRAAQDLIGALPNARVVQIDGAGHAIMAEKPDELLEALRAFVP